MYIIGDLSGDAAEADPKEPETEQRVENVNSLNDRLHTLVMYVAVIKQYYIHYIVNKDVPSNLLSDHSWLNLPETFLYTALLLDFCGAMLSNRNGQVSEICACSMCVIVEFVLLRRMPSIKTSTHRSTL